MEGKGFKVVTLLLIVLIIIALGVGAFFILKQNKEQEDLKNNLNGLQQSLNNIESSLNKLDELEGNVNELKETTEVTDEEVSKVTLTEAEKEEIVEELYMKQLEEISTDYDYDVEVTITSLEELVETFPEFLEMYPDAENEIFASVAYKITAKGDATYDIWMAGNGEYDEDGSFIKFAVVEVAKENGEYVIVSSGTGW